MTRLVRCTVLACLLVTLVISGCSSWARTQRATLGWVNPHADGETLTQSPHEHYHSVSTMSDLDSRAIVDDLDLLFLTERSTRLSRWRGR